jgi:hypothetical protein
MPSTIVFAASRGDSSVTLRVAESPDEIFSAWVDAAGRPMTLTMDPGVRPVYVNPATVAYWQELAGGPGLRGV